MPVLARPNTTPARKIHNYLTTLPLMIYTNRIVDMYVGLEPPSALFVEHLKQLAALSPEVLLQQADEGEQNRHGEVEYIYSHEQRLLRYLILVTHLDIGSSVETLHKKTRSALIWAMYHQHEPVLRIMFCVYTHELIREAIWYSAKSSERVMHARIGSFNHLMRAAESIPYCPEGFLLEAVQVLEMLQTQLSQEMEAEPNARWMLKEMDEGQKILAQLLTADKALPPKLPLPTDFLTKYGTNDG